LPGSGWASLSGTALIAGGQGYPQPSTGTGFNVMRLTILTCAAILIGATSGAQAAALKPGGGLNDAKCKTLWTIVSPNGATISKDTADPYIVDFTMVDIDNDGTIDANEFISGCKAGLVKAQ
jgi:hypothetical protein